MSKNTSSNTEYSFNTHQNENDFKETVNRSLDETKHNINRLIDESKNQIPHFNTIVNSLSRTITSNCKRDFRELY